VRVIAGRYGGRRLQAPIGSQVRPTSDRVKEAIFNILAGRLENAIVLDMFAGTGNLGIEALSRGAQKVIFIEQSQNSLRTIRSNLASLGIAAEDYQLIAGDAFKAIGRLRRLPERFDLVFVDPPYDKGFAEKALSTLAEADVMQSGGLVIVETASRETVPQALHFELLRQSVYGDTTVYFFAKVTAAAGPGQRS